MTKPLEILHLPTLIDKVATEGVPVHGADALGIGLLSNGMLGADVLHVPAGNRFAIHTHPGDHLLYCARGEGTITIDGVTYDTKPGDLYMVEGLIPHAVGAGSTDHVIVAVGANPHKGVDDLDRMEFVDWEGNPVTSPIFVGEE